MLVLGADQIRALAPPRRIIEALRETFSKGGVVAVRTPAQMPGDSPDRLFVSMLAMDQSGGPVIKLLTIQPENRPKGLLTVQGAIVVFNKDGAADAILDGTVITHLRTGAASALASEYLSRKDSAHLLVVGTGAIAPTMALSHCAVRPIKQVSVWGRERQKGSATADAIRELVAKDIEVVVADDLQKAVSAADIISSSTSTTKPIIRGKWLRPGAHVDLIGSFQPSKRESDDDVVMRARIFVDTLHGALHESGDIIDPLTRGIINESRIEGELADLTSGRVKGRTSDEQITMFKSCGTAIEDLSTARMLVQAARAAQIELR